MKKRHCQKITKWEWLKLQELAVMWCSTSWAEMILASYLDAPIASLMHPAIECCRKTHHTEMLCNNAAMCNSNKELCCGLTTAADVFFLHLISQEAELDGKIYCFLPWRVTSVFCFSSWFQTYQLETIRLIWLWSHSCDCSPSWTVMLAHTVLLKFHTAWIIFLIEVFRRKIHSFSEK